MTMRTGMSCFGISIDPLKTSLDKKKKKKKKLKLKYFYIKKKKNNFFFFFYKIFNN